MSYGQNSKLENENAAQLLTGLQEQLRQATCDLQKMRASFDQSFSVLADKVQQLQSQMDDLLATEVLSAEVDQAPASQGLAGAPRTANSVDNEEATHELPKGDLKPTTSILLDPELATRAFDGTQRVVAEMRQALQYFLRHPNELEVLRGLQDSSLAIASRLSEKNPISQIASSLADLIADQLLLPEKTNKSALRTVAQALECLSSLTELGSLKRMQFLEMPVLVCVDDETRAHHQILSAMAKVGVQVQPFLAPAEALKLLTQTTCNVIMLDMSMPQMSGLDLCRQIRNLELHKRTPIIFVTGSANAESRAQTSLNGGNDFVAKPFHLSEIALKALLWIYRKHIGSA